MSGEPARAAPSPPRRVNVALLTVTVPVLCSAALHKTWSELLLPLRFRVPLLLNSARAKQQSTSNESFVYALKVPVLLMVSVWNPPLAGLSTRSRPADQ